MSGSQGALSGSASRVNPQGRGLMLITAGVFCVFVAGSGFVLSAVLHQCKDFRYFPSRFCLSKVVILGQLMQRLKYRDGSYTRAVNAEVEVP